MAVSKAPAPPAPIPGKPPPDLAKGTGKSVVWLLGGLGGFAMVAIGLGSPTLLVFMIIGFAPTVAAGLIDRDPERHAAIAVGAMSLGAMIPMILGQLTARSGSGYSVLSDPFAWLTVYGAAAIGWAVHTTVPVIVVMFSDMRAEWRRRELQKRQEELVEEWGDEVTSKKTPPARAPARATSS
ncbi:MAG TPA: hypothetical protein VGB82_14455 [Alphaproteobacteria bacterium]